MAENLEEEGTSFSATFLLVPRQVFGLQEGLPGGLSVAVPARVRPLFIVGNGTIWYRIFFKLTPSVHPVFHNEL